jgi:DNA-binding FadR family transcriptional regulator
MSPVRRVTQHDAHTYVLDSLGSRIAAGDLAAETVLTLADLEEEYQVSRTVIREVVRVLESHGMLVSRRRVGVTVQPIARWDVLDASIIQWRLAGPGSDRQLAELMELRSAVEPVAARLAAERASRAQRQRLVELAAVLESLGRRGLGDSPEFLDADIAFHSLLLEASGNPLLAQLSGPVASAIEAADRRQRAGRSPL